MIYGRKFSKRETLAKMRKIAKRIRAYDKAERERIEASENVVLLRQKPRKGV